MLALSTLLVGTQPAGADTWTLGIDISHWQGDIDWSYLATGNVKFVIAKATEGQDYVDPMYDDNKAGATGIGLKFTGYHFARPDATLGDAAKEAAHFVQTAKLAKGNLIPALDLEANGGLSVTALQTWVRQWLKKVTSLVGAKPMIYSSPSFWQTSMGDTREFAFWQYTNCRAVRGINGCVDGDRYNGSDFSPVTI
ncbi:MAG: glycoside hydrolase family 25 protein [Actinobacteria bacterium]|nr:glycoside hydrolase family 25 protein [Actinomycetota bacterium]